MTPPMTHSEPAREAVAVPAGWKLVPVEPTRAMKDAVSRKVDDFAREHARLFVSEIWQDMLSASPAASRGEPVACGVYPPPETYGGSPNDEWTGRPPSAPAGVKVKPVQWEPYWGGGNDDIPSWRARTPVGLTLDVDFASERLKKHGDADPVRLAEKQAEAFAHYESRIRSSLHPDTQAAGVDRYDRGRRDMLNAILALNPTVSAKVAKWAERAPDPQGRLPFEVALWVTEVAEQLGIKSVEEMAEAASPAPDAKGKR